MAARDVSEEHRASTPLELFFDLVFVIAVGQAAAAQVDLIAHHRARSYSPHGLGLLPVDCLVAVMVAQAASGGSDDQLLSGIKAFEEAGADQILFAGAVREGTEQLERVAALMSI